MNKYAIATARNNSHRIMRLRRISNVHLMRRKRRELDGLTAALTTPQCMCDATSRQRCMHALRIAAFEFRQLQYAVRFPQFA